MAKVNQKGIPLFQLGELCQGILPDFKLSVNDGKQGI
jgi:hypothetical protein